MSRETSDLGPGAVLFVFVVETAEGRTTLQYLPGPLPVARTTLLRLSQSTPGQLIVRRHNYIAELFATAARSG